MLKLKQLIVPPPFDDEENNRVARTLRVALVLAWAGILVVALDSLVIGNLNPIFPLLLGGLLLLVPFWLARSGHLRPATLLFLGTLLIVVTYVLHTEGGLYDVGMATYPAIIVCAGLLLRRRGLFLVTVLTILAVSFLAWGELWGWFVTRPIAREAPLADWITASVILGVIALVVSVMADDLRESLRQAREHLAERKRAEEALESLSKFPAENPNPILRVGSDGIVLYANQAAAALLQNWGGAIGAPAPAPWHSWVMEAVAGQTVQTVEAMFGDHAYVFNLVPISKGGYVNIYARDVTDRERAEEALRQAHQQIQAQLQELRAQQTRLEETNRDLQIAYLKLADSERLLRLVIDSSPAYISYVDADDMCYRFVNRPYESFFGRPLDTIVGHPVRDVLGAASYARARPSIECALAGETVSLENRLDTPRGQRWVSTTYVPDINAQGRVAGLVVLSHDITERKQAEEAQRRYAEQLAAQNAELDAFAHTVAHDLKSPISAIIGYSELLLREYSNLSPEDLSESFRQIGLTGERLNSIIEELMLLAGVRQREVTSGPLDMGGIVRESIERLYILVHSRRAQITLLDEAAWPVAFGYAPWIEEVWTNYISNAIKYGGRPPQVEVGAIAQPDGEARFWARDNGPGLSAEAQTELFIPFTRLVQVGGEGHGLGLSIVRRIVEKLGGKVGVESKPGQGSIFFFTLPMASTPGAPAAHTGDGAAAL